MITLLFHIPAQIPTFCITINMKWSFSHDVQHCCRDILFFSSFRPLLLSSPPLTPLPLNTSKMWEGLFARKTSRRKLDHVGLDVGVGKSLSFVDSVSIIVAAKVVTVILQYFFDGMYPGAHLLFQQDLHHDDRLPKACLCSERETGPWWARPRNKSLFLPDKDWSEVFVGPSSSSPRLSDAPGSWCWMHNLWSDH